MIMWTKNPVCQKTSFSGLIRVVFGVLIEKHPVEAGSLRSFPQDDSFTR